MTKTQERKIRAELRELEKRGRDIMRGHYLPWGVPWCAGPGAPYHQPPLCEGCAGRALCADKTALLVPRVVELRQLLAPPPVQEGLW